ncbi:uncharacterized protein LOC116249687 isoform X1 [Nymphaea colorata]|nr:uncharacterized protein LOC116249687 isoform X1 [Nymphaea colorata]
MRGMADRGVDENNDRQKADDVVHVDPNGADLSQVMSNPFFIHHSDNLGNVLVSQHFNGENYGTWSRAMLMALSAKNKIGFIDGSIKEPEKDDPSYHLWVRSNNMILSWILNSVNKDIVESVIYLTNAREVWKDLRERFTQSLAPRIYQIQSSISRLQQATMTVALYFTKLKALWDELSSYSLIPMCSCGGMKSYSEQIQREHVIQFLMGLNDSYNAVRGQILLLDPLPNVNKVYAMVLQEEKQREARFSGSANGGTAALAVKQSERFKSHDANYGGFYRTKGGRQIRPVCSHCRGIRHIKEKCFKLIGYPPGHRFYDPNFKSSIAANVFQKNNTLDVKLTPFDGVGGLGCEGLDTKGSTPAFTLEEYHKLLSLVKNQHTNINFAGPGIEDDDWAG